MATRRAQYDARFKRNAILVAEEIGNSAAARRLDVSESTIRGWRLQREALFKCEPGRKGFRGPRCGRHTELEKKVAQFVIEQRNRLLGVSVELIQWKARDVAREMGIPRESFKASRGWAQKFMRRNGFSLRRTTSIRQKLPSDYEAKLLEFQRYVIDLRRSSQMPLAHIGNADQTPVFLDMPMSRTVNETGAPPSPHKDNRERKDTANRDAGLLGGWAQVATVHHFPAQNHPEGTVPQQRDCPLPRERLDGHCAYA